MKQKVFFILAMLLGILVPQGAKAYDFSAVAPTGQTLYYYTSGNNVIVVWPSYSNYGYTGYTQPSGDLEIPSSVTHNGTTYSVISIGGSAFAGCSGLTSVTIPNSVTSIGERAFYNCSGLTSVTIPNSVTSIGNDAFYSVGTVFCSEEFSFYNGEYTDCPWGASACNGFIADSLIYIDATKNEVVSYVRGLSNANIPNSVTSIGERAFYNCTGLTSVTIPNSVTSIGGSAFSGCIGLTTLNFNADSCTVTYDWLNGCTSLTTLNIGNNVRIIPNYFAYNCSGLTSVTIPNSVTSIGSSAFSKCSGFTGTLTIPNSVTSIGRNAFDSCVNLQSVVLPNNLSKLDTSVFRYCIGLTSVTIPSSVTSIGRYAFFRCGGLTSVTIPNSVTSIGQYAFLYCSGLTSVTIPNSVTNIGGYAFSGCSGLTGALTIPNSVTSIGGCAFLNCSGLTTLNFNADSCTSVSDTWLNGCTALATVNIGNNVRIIPNYFARGLTGLTSITIPNSVTSIGKYAFQNCSGLTTLNFNADSCATAGSQSNPVFSGCNRVRTLQIGENVRYIPSYIFNTLDSVDSVHYKAIGCNTAFCDRLTTAAKQNVRSLILGDSVQRIPANAFRNLTGVSSLTLPNSITTIGSQAFKNCTNLSVIYLSPENSIEGVGVSAFGGCAQMAGSIVLPNIVNLGDSAFSNCGMISSVELGNGISSIGTSTFINCDHMTYLTIGSGVTNIAPNAFSGCSEIQLITSRALNPPTVYSGTFADVDDNISVRVPCQAVNAYVQAPYWSHFNHIDGQFDYFFSATSSDATRGSVTIVHAPTCENIEAHIQANPYHGYRFVSWSDGDTNNPRYIVIVQDSVLTALFVAENPTNYIIVATTNDATMGYVTGGGSYTSGATATLTATANTGYHFVQWNDGNTTNPRTVTVTADATYTAIFAPDQSQTQFTVTATANDATMGYVTGGGTYTSGATATLTATANTGYHFVQWNDGNTTNPRTVTVTANATYMALFEADQSDAPQIAYVGVDANGHNSVCWMPRSGSAAVSYRVYREGTQSGVYEQVGIVQATGAASYTWSDDQSNPAVRAYSYRLTEVAANGTESAQSAPHTTMHLQINQGQGGAWNLTWTPYAGFAYSTYRIYRGATATSLSLLTTLPASSTTYSDLTAGGVNYYYQIEVVQLNGNKSVTGNSRSNIANSDPEPQRYTLTVLSADITRGTVTGGGSYEQGETATLEAQAAEGFVFLQWQDGSTANPRTITVTANGTYMAYFTQTEGIADAEGSNVTIIARNGRILVSGAEGRQVMLSDAMGRILYRGTATEPLTVEAPATGIYLLQVEGHPAHRISVVR